MVASTHQHVWEVVRTAWPNRLGWGIECTQCKLVLLDGWPKAEVEAAMARLAEQAQQQAGVAVGNS